MTEYMPVNDVTQEFFEMEPHELNSVIRCLGKGALVGVSYQLLDENGEQYNRLLLRKTKAFVERAPERLVTVIATEEQVSIEPNAFYSGIMRMSPENDA